MPTYNDYGIILGNYDFSESDKILNIYTKENGLVRAIAKGAKKPKSKIAGKTDQLSCCYFQFARGKNLDVISDCSQINSFKLLRSNLDRLSYAILFLEIVNSFAHELESESEHIYDLLYSKLDELQTIVDIDLFAIHFVLEFLSIHGLKPQLETCVSCSKEVNKSIGHEVLYKYSFVLGGILCEECAELIDHTTINPTIFSLLKSETFSSLSKTDMKCALELLKEHVNVRAKNKIKTFDLVFSL